MKKLMTSVLLSFTTWAAGGLNITNILVAQNMDQNTIALFKQQEAVIDVHVETNMTDEQLGEQVNKKIRDFVFYGVYDYVTADVTNGVVILKGWTHEAWIADILIKKLSQTEGVKSINNQIQLASGSEDLARRAVRAIYSDAMFEKYSFSSGQPIHVVVNNNSIILAGTVASKTELERAAFLVDFKTNTLTLYNQLETAD